ncbi:hypothetical protein P618_200094 [Holospora obtusa F1]|uniref:Uncharacterized protein n=1 Tax=Holospora obtusa F1 TaxID=1399147 RepID=W6TFC2_HOLOB|nr:hypothetical protein [Holospora obtusa]ETZ07706.1 hypothetical protein P618_200094 [Holospora obtusa F1]
MSKANEDKKIEEIAKLFNASISVYRRLKKLGFSYKKTFTDLQSSQEKRKRYKETVRKSCIY